MSYPVHSDGIVILTSQPGAPAAMAQFNNYFTICRAVRLLYHPYQWYTAAQLIQK